MWSAILLFVTAVVATHHGKPQVPFNTPDSDTRIDQIGCLPKIQYSLTEDDDFTPTPVDMTLHSLHVSGSWSDSIDLTFFSDGYTSDEESKFIDDAKTLTADIVSSGGAMSHVSHLLNIYGVFVPSAQSGIGDHDTPRNGSAFGLYRPGPELRGVYVDQPKRARAACRYWREKGAKGGEGGCDQPILLGNDPLYGGLGGEFTIITASKLNGPLVLRHELGHSLIGVGEEYEGGYVYSGVNADKVSHLDQLKWHDFLTCPNQRRIEDARVPLQAYPWHDLSLGAYHTIFNSSSSDNQSYPTALLRMSLSSIPYAEHIELQLNGQPINLRPAYPGGMWEGSKDRRWLEIPFPDGLPMGLGEVLVSLTHKGKQEPAGQGGKMITSVEIIEYGPKDRFNSTEGFIGAFPTYSLDGKMTLRPTNEACLMRKVNYPSFCPVCSKGLETALRRKIAAKKEPSALVR